MLVSMTMVFLAASHVTPKSNAAPMSRGLKKLLPPILYASKATFSMSLTGALPNGSIPNIVPWFRLKLPAIFHKLSSVFISHIVLEPGSGFSM